MSEINTSLVNLRNTSLVNSPSIQHLNSSEMRNSVFFDNLFSGEIGVHLISV